MMAETGVPVDGDGKLKDALLALGRTQIDAMFAQQGDSRFTVDDSEFVPMLECVLTAFMVSKTAYADLRNYVDPPLTKEQFAQRHILFFEDEPDYVARLFG